MEERSPDSGEYRDSVNVSSIIGATIVGGLALALIIDLAVNAHMPIGVTFFALLFPLAAVGAVLVALSTASLTYDRSGWRFERRLLGRTLESDQGTWGEIAATSYRQWFVGGRNSSALYGELTLLDVTGRPLLRARTQFFARGDPSNGHAVGKRRLGLSQPTFYSFVRLIDDETPQLNYVWLPADVDEGAHFGGLFWNPGPPRYVQVPRENAPRRPVLDPDKPYVPRVWHGSKPPEIDPPT